MDKTTKEINDKVSKALNKVETKTKTLAKLTEVLSSHKKSYDIWDHLETDLKTCINSDEIAFKQLKQRLGDNALRAILTKVVPQFKEEFMDAIEKQISLIEEVNGN